MKKLITIILLAVCISQLKAQTALYPLYNYKQPLLNYQMLKVAGSFKTDSILPQTNKYLQLNLINGNSTVTEAAISIAAMDHMPISKTYSNDRMPIVRTDEPGMHYHMLVTPYAKAKPETLVLVKP